MQIDRIFYPIRTLGFGNRIGIWTVGCEHKCFNCANPELWEADPSRDIPLEMIFDTLIRIYSANPDLDGVTISGGEPFLQSEHLAELVQFIRLEISGDILVYSGFSIEELSARNDAVQDILQNIAVLVDGKYLEELNDNLPLRGSSNQRVLVLNSAYEERYLEHKNGVRTVQNVHYGNGAISFGIPIRGYRESVSTGLKTKGVIARE